MLTFEEIMKKMEEQEDDKEEAKETSEKEGGAKDKWTISDFSDQIEEWKKAGLDDESKLQGMIDRATEIAKKSTESAPGKATRTEVLGIMQGFMKKEEEEIEHHILLEASAGFDLTDIKGSDWKTLCKQFGISTKPTLDHKSLAWVWKGAGIKIHTGNDPITGKYAQTEIGGGATRGPEKNYASYIGIYGSDKNKVKAIFDFITDKATVIKDSDPNRSDYI